MKICNTTILLSFCLLGTRVVQAAPAPVSVVIGTVDEAKLRGFRQAQPSLVTSSIIRVATSKKLSAVFPNRILWFGSNTKFVDITNEVLSALKTAGVKPVPAKAPSTVAVPAKAPDTTAKVGDSQKTAAKAALKALRKLSAAIEVGVNKQVYGERLIDAKVEVSENLRELPAGTLRTEIQAAMDAYADAASIWDDSFQYKYIAVLRVGPPGDIIKKYSIPVDTYEGDLRETTQEDRSLILSTIWAAARSHMDKASALMGSQ